jgi:hypothetical protein
MCHGQRVRKGGGSTMRSAGWAALLLVVSVSLAGWAQCGCGIQDGPSCYRTFRTNETIEISVIAPIDYFMCRGTTVSPSIFGWRVEAWDGTIVRSVVHSDQPKGRWMTMEWDLNDGSGNLVPSGFYRIIVMTTDGDVSYPVRILERCRPCIDCFCWSTAPMGCSGPCPIPFGELYLSLAVGEMRACSGLLIRVHVEFEFECADSCPGPCPDPCSDPCSPCP